MVILVLRGKAGDSLSGISLRGRKTSKSSALDIVKRLQARNNRRIQPPRKEDRVGFAFSTKDRVEMTVATLASIDTDCGFDLVWVDGSNLPEGKELPHSYKLRNVRLMEVHSDVCGGPDRAIQFGLRRLLDLGYDYCGLIENDMVFEPGWFQRLMELFHLAAHDGLVCGAATVRSYESRVIEYRNRYTLSWNIGAAMVLFSRPAAQLILDQYHTLRVTARSVYRFYADFFEIDLGCGWDLWGGARDRRLAMDWGYSPLLYGHGFSSVGSIPSLVEDLEFDVREFLRTNPVGSERNNAGPARPQISFLRRVRIKATGPFFAARWIVFERFPRVYRLLKNLCRSLFPGRALAASGRSSLP